MPTGAKGALKDAFKAILSNAERTSQLTVDDVAEALADATEAYINSLTIEVPSGQVVIQVAGGSGAPAVGTPNPAPIQCTIK